jgi:hypothetical protein
MQRSLTAAAAASLGGDEEGDEDSGKDEEGASNGANEEGIHQVAATHVRDKSSIRSHPAWPSNESEWEGTSVSKSCFCFQDRTAAVTLIDGQGGCVGTHLGAKEVVRAARTEGWRRIADEGFARAAGPICDHPWCKDRCFATELERVCSGLQSMFGNTAQPAT